MAAPFPTWATAGGTAPTSLANELFGHYVWIARWSDEIVNDVDLDNKKFGQLVYVHCREFDNLVTVPISDDYLSAVVTRFAADGLEWSTRAQLKSDFQDIKQQCASLYNWSVTNVGDLEYASNSIDTLGVMVETPTLTTPKPAAVQTRVQALRDLFT